MAHYLISVLDEKANSGTPEEMARIEEFNRQLRTGGHWVFAGGLAAPGEATVIDGRTEPPLFTDGPYAETKEFTAGFWIIDAADHDEALRLAARGSNHCNRRVEVRPFLA